MNHLLSLAYPLINRVLRFEEPIVSILASYRKKERLNASDRTILGDWIFAIVRHLQKINYVCPQARPQDVLLLALFFENKINQLPENIINYELLKLAESHQASQFSGSLNALSEFPLWLTEKLSIHYSHEQIIALGQSMNQEAPLDVRVNILKITRDNALNQLLKDGFSVCKTPFSAWGIRFENKAKIHNHPLFIDGSLEIQDEGSQLLALATQAKRSEMVVDFCAGAGGKTLAMAMMMGNTGRIYACDTIKERLERFKPRLIKSSLTNVTIQSIDSEYDNKLQRLKNKCDAVLLDVPCSGMGTLRRQPDLKYRQNAKKVSELCATQARILRAAASLLKDQGRLIYATCSLLAEENEQQIESFLNEYPNFTLHDCTNILPKGTITPYSKGMIYLSPTQSQTDGFFVATLINSLKK